jgi:uncharacterized protein YdeI (YjbR/CyaY-like superfamily)
MSGDGPPALPANWLDEHEHLEIRSAQELRVWLGRHGLRDQGLWVVTWMKRQGAPYVGRWDVLDELLCHGWIDGVRRRVDVQRTAQWVSPRRHATWTASHRQRFAALVEQGRMLEAGLAARQAALDAGTWMGLPEVDRLQLPADLTEKLANRPEAEAWFLAQAASYRRNLLRWLASARSSNTRAARIICIVEASVEGRRLRNF